MVIMSRCARVGFLQPFVKLRIIMDREEARRQLLTGVVTLKKTLQ